MSKKVRSSRSCICLPTANTNPASIPVNNKHILYATYNTRTNMIQLNILVSEQPNDPKSSLYLHKFMYTVKDNEKEKAIQFCRILMSSVYQGNRKLCFSKYAMLT